VETAVFRDVTPCSLVKRYQPTKNFRLQRRTVSIGGAVLGCGLCWLKVEGALLPYGPKASDPILDPRSFCSSGLCEAGYSIYFSNYTNVGEQGNNVIHSVHSPTPAFRTTQLHKAECHCVLRLAEVTLGHPPPSRALAGRKGQFPGLI
jgi:hypothetical protein